jgi:hypothetical protein
MFWDGFGGGVCQVFGERLRLGITSKLAKTLEFGAWLDQRRKTSNDKYRDPSPFDCAQGQDDDVKQSRRCCTGGLHYVQDDDVKATSAAEG